MNQFVYGRRFPQRDTLPRGAIVRSLDTRTRQHYRVSALVSVYSATSFLPGLFEDLFSQTLYSRGELEIILVDSGSPQQDWSVILETASTHENIRAIRTHMRESLYVSWNRAIMQSRGDYLTNANVDDRHRYDALELLADTLDSDDSVALVYSGCLYSKVENETFEENPGTRQFITPAYFAPTLLLHYPFGPQPMWRRQVHEEIGLFDGSFRAAGDWDFAIRLSGRYRAQQVRQNLGLYLLHDNALSFRDNTMSRENQVILERYHRAEVVEALYRMEGIPMNNPREKARVHLDMGVRALGYICPDGVIRSRLPFAMSCFEQAVGLDPDWTAPLHNMAIALALEGHRDEALRLLTSLVEKTDDEIVRTNEAALKKILREGDETVALQPMEAGLPLPRQQELFFKGIPEPNRRMTAGSVLA